MNIKSIAAGAKAAARLDRKNRRERIALVCLRSIITSGRWNGTYDVVNDAVGMADLLIAALNKKEEVAS